MALQTSGAISLGDIATEFGGSAPHSLSEYYGAASGIPTSGAISVKGFYGKSSVFAFTITSNQTNANLATLATNAGWDGSSALQATINSGVYISSNSTATPALTVSGSFPSGVTLINNGYIVGMGGNGSKGMVQVVNNSSVRNSGGTGGGALSVSSPITIANNGTIGGGGGGGAGGGLVQASSENGLKTTGGGGGGGGGRGGNTNSSGGAGGERYATSNANHGYGGTGGAGTVSGSGAGGSGGYKYGEQGAWTRGGNGGAGGNWGSSGSNAANGTKSNQANGPLYFNATSPGSGGYAVQGNSNITWSATGTRLGAIS